jgi:SAM-dependent methyltransferase
MFDQIADVYDLLKSHRRYDEEANTLTALIERHRPGAHSILEVACGTGSLLAQLDGYQRAGLDLSENMLAVARTKLPLDVELHHGDLATADLGRTFDVVLLLDGAVGYVPPTRIDQAITRLRRHLAPGGLLIIEPWFTPEDWTPGRPHLVHHQCAGVFALRLGYGHPSGTIDFHTVIADSTGIRYFDERYDFTLWGKKDLQAALARAGLTAREEAPAIFKRGLLLAQDAAAQL